MQKRGIKLNIVVGLLIAALLGSGLYFTKNAMADIKSDGTVGVDPDSIPNGTLAIGTHLIYLQSWNEELNKIAEQSEAKYGRNERFYKSELAGGQWFDIGMASSIESINKNGIPVDKSKIAAVGFLYHTKADGVTYDLRNGGSVNIFELDEIYKPQFRGV